MNEPDGKNAYCSLAWIFTCYWNEVSSNVLFPVGITIA